MKILWNMKGVGSGADEFLFSEPEPSNSFSSGAGAEYNLIGSGTLVPTTCYCLISHCILSPVACLLFSVVESRDPRFWRLRLWAHQIWGLPH